MVQTGGDYAADRIDSIDGAVRCAVKVRSRSRSTTAVGRLMTLSASESPSASVIRLQTRTDLHGDLGERSARTQADARRSYLCLATVRDHVHDGLGPALRGLVHSI